VAQPSSNTLKDNEAVPYHKRIAMGAALDGTSLKSKGSTAPQPSSKGASAPIARKNK
jgi:hypothetical protein